MENKKLLIVGASSDVGADYIRRYHDRYDAIVGTYCSNAATVETLAQETGGKVKPIHADMLNENSVDELVEFIREQEAPFGYFLYLPAAKPGMARIKETDIEDVRRDVEIQVISLIKILEALVPPMEEQEFGRICFMLSSVTVNPVAYQTSYMVSKYAMLGLMKGVAWELATKKILVNGISPSMISTKFSEDTPPLAKKKMLSMSPLRRFAETKDVTTAIAFLLDDDNGYMSGINLPIMGGRHTILKDN